MLKLYAHSLLFRQMVAQESHFLFQRHLKWRWAVVLGLWGVILLAHLMHRPSAIITSGVIITTALSVFTLFLQIMDWRGKIVGRWNIYLSVLVDHLLLVGHLLLISRGVPAEGVVFSPENLAFPLITLYTALRMDYGGLSFSLACNFIATNLVFFSVRNGLDPALVARFPELGLDGHIFRLIFTTFLGFCFFTIPLGLRHLLAKQEAIFQAQEELQNRYQADLENEVTVKTTELRQKNQELQAALDEVRTLEGLLPICSRCKKIRDDSGRWLGMEQYLANRAGVRLTHGLCEQCFSIIYPDIAEEVIIQLRDLEDKKK